MKIKYPRLKPPRVGVACRIEALQLCLCGGERRTLRQPREYADAGFLRQVGLQEQPALRLRRKECEGRRHDSDDEAGLLVHSNRSPDKRGVPTKGAHP